MPRCVLAYNPTAGRYPSRILAERAAKVLSEFDWKVHLEQTESAGHITSLAKQAAQEQVEAFFVVGGDGSVNRAVAGLIGIVGFCGLVLFMEDASAATPVRVGTNVNVSQLAENQAEVTIAINPYNPDNP